MQEKKNERNGPSKIKCYGQISEKKTYETFQYIIPKFSRYVQEIKS